MENTGQSGKIRNKKARYLDRVYSMILRLTKLVKSLTPSRQLLFAYNFCVIISRYDYSSLRGLH